MFHTYPTALAAWQLLPNAPPRQAAVAAAVPADQQIIWLQMSWLMSILRTAVENCIRKGCTKRARGKVPAQSPHCGPWQVLTCPAVSKLQQQFIKFRQSSSNFCSTSRAHLITNTILLTNSALPSLSELRTLVQLSPAVPP